MTDLITEIQTTVLNIINSRVPDDIYYNMDAYNNRYGFTVVYNIGWFKRILITYHGAWTGDDRLYRVDYFHVELQSTFSTSYGYGANSFDKMEEFKIHAFKMDQVMHDAKQAATLEALNTERHRVIKFLKRAK